MAQTRMAVCLTDPTLKDDPIVFCNEAFERLTGYGEDENLGRNCRFLQGPETDQNEVGRIRDALREEKVAKQMAREVSHRLKNVFAVIGGIVNITGRSMKGREISDRINDRIQALGRSYEPTLDDAFLGTIEVGQAIRAILRPYDPENERVTFIGDGVRTEPNAVSAIGLTLHELATNATKYGALSNEAGRIEVSWRHEKDRHGRSSIVVGWKERGGPPLPEEPTVGGTGFEIADALLAHSGGGLDRHWEADGLRAEIHFPLSN